MKVLADIKNYLFIHNGKIEDQKITEDIVINDSDIIINHASDLQIVYKIDSDNVFLTNIIVKANNEIDLIELYDFKDKTTYDKHIKIEENCNVRRYVDNQSLSSANVNLKEQVEVFENTKITCAYVELSDNNVEANINFSLVGQNADALVRLAALSKGTENKHYTVTLDHLNPYTIGAMENYGVVKDKGSLILDGIGTIKRGNYKSSSHQVNKIIVFNDGCKAAANPYLYIDEYDVKAGHGASVGKIDEEHLYYLQSRGLTKQEAMHLITYGYFIPVMEFISNDALKEQFSDTLKEKVGI